MIARVYPVIAPANAAIAIMNNRLGYPKVHTQPDGRPVTTQTFAVPEELSAGGFAVFFRRNEDVAAGIATGTRRDVSRRTEVKSEVEAPVAVQQAQVKR
jgi:hypothetical protein